MYNSIILSSCLFGSLYLFSLSLDLMNRQQLEYKKIPLNLIIINSFTFALSGSIVIYCFSYSYLHLL